MYIFWKQYVNVYMHGEILKSSQPTSLLIICLLIFGHGNTDLGKWATPRMFQYTLVHVGLFIRTIKSLVVHLHYTFNKHILSIFMTLTISFFFIFNTLLY